MSKWTIKLSKTNSVYDGMEIEFDSEITFIEGIFRFLEWGYDVGVKYGEKFLFVTQEDLKI